MKIIVVLSGIQTTTGFDGESLLGMGRLNLQMFKLIDSL